MIARAGVDVDAVGFRGDKSVRGHVDRGNLLILLAVPDVQRLIRAHVLHGIQFIGSVTNRCGADLPHVFQLPRAVFQRAIRNGAAILVEIDDIRLPRLIQTNHQTHRRDPVKGQISQPSVVQIVGTALKQEHGALSLPQSLPHTGVGAHIIVGQRFHIGSVVGVADQLGQIGAVGVARFVGSRLRRCRNQQRRRQERRQQAD